MSSSTRTRGGEQEVARTPDDRKVRRTLMSRDRGLHLVMTVLSVIAFIVVWWLASAVLKLANPLYLPTPGAVWDAFVRANTIHPVIPGSSTLEYGEENNFIWEHLLASLARIGSGVGLGIVVGLPLGLVMASNTWLGRLFEPYLNFLRSLPPLAYLGLVIIWCGIGDQGKIVLLFLAAFPPIAMATISGVRGVKEDQINAALSLGASRVQAVRAVVLPAILPEVITGIRVAIGFAWTTVVAAEIVNGLPGIGGLAYLAGNQTQTPLVIACILVIGITAILLDELVKLIERIIVPWRGKA